MSLESATELKRKLINDPDQAFWEGNRAKIDVPLGNAVVFSLLAILLDAMDTLKDKGVDLKAYDEITVRYSHPNWISASSVTALQYYRDAAAIATAVVSRGLQHSRGGNGVQVPCEVLSGYIANNRKALDGLPAFSVQYEYKSYLAASRGVSAGIKWELVFESCAAGFPYLMEGEPVAGDAVETEVAQKFRKLLVIDIGAGSTDAGYMLRTITIAGKNRPPSLALLWLPAAAALEKAGNWLTDQVREYWAQQGKVAGRDEAEAHKIGLGMKWSEVPFVKEWCEAIAQHISEYVYRVPDNERLPKQPALEIVLTGGSSVVQPLRPVLAEGVRKALANRGITNAKLLDETQFVSLSSPSFVVGLNEVQIAQTAVCLGASDPRLSILKHYPHLP